MFPGFGLLLNLVAGRLRSRSEETRLQQELLAHRRRQLLHARIPDLTAARQTFGFRLDSLGQLLAQHDPAGLGSAAAASPLYPELARTLLYQLPKATTPTQRVQLLQQEVYLWFGRQVRPPQPSDAMVQELERWLQPPPDELLPPAVW